MLRMRAKTCESAPIVPERKSGGGAAERRPSVPGALYPDKFMRSGAVRTARLAHNQKVVGSNPTSRTQLRGDQL